MYAVNITIDICCATVMMVLIGYLLTQQRVKTSRLGQMFLMICGFNLLMLLGDIPNWACDGKMDAGSLILLPSASALYFACSGPLLLFFIGYMAEYLSPKVKVNAIYWKVSLCLTVLQIILSVLSPVTGMYFTITDQNVYERGDWFFVSQLVPVLLYAVGLCILLSCRRYLNWKEKLFFLSYIILPVTAEIFQIVFYGVALVNAGATLSILLIFVNLQWDRELLIRKREKELAEARIDMMLSQIQPHFLFNCLTAISHLCTADPVKAKQTTQEFSRFLRANIDSLTDKRPILFEKELEHVVNYFQLEQKRFGDRLKVEYDMEVTDFVLPSLTLQPLVENAVRHGVMRREEGGTVRLSTWETDTDFVITVTDDGVGFDPSVPSNGDRPHIGLQNVKYRLKSMCRGSLEIDSILGKGTTITITIPKEGKTS
ncbi:histidine kinase [[Clostridium] leptum]|nr:histidine kinase [[Clostridium] leptum]